MVFYYVNGLIKGISLILVLRSFLFLAYLLTY